MIGIEKEFLQRSGVPHKVLRHVRERAVSLVHVLDLPVAPLEQGDAAKHLGSCRSAFLEVTAADRARPDFASRRDWGFRYLGSWRGGTRPPVVVVVVVVVVVDVSSSSLAATSEVVSLSWALYADGGREGPTESA